MSVHPIEFWSRFFNHMLGILQTLLTNFPLRKQALLKHPVLAKQPLASKVLSFLHVSHRPLGHIAAGTGRGYRWLWASGYLAETGDGSLATNTQKWGNGNVPSSTFFDASHLRVPIHTPKKNKKSEGIRRNSATSEDCDSPSNIFLQTAHHRQREEKYHWPSGRGRFPFFAVSENNAPFHVNSSLAWHLWLGFRCGWGKPMNGKTRCYPSVRSQPCQISQFGGYVEEYQFSCDWLVFTKLEGKAWWNSSMITVPVAVAVVPTLSPSNFQRALKMGSHGRSGEGSRDR